jgi:hypothetical protein
MSSGACDDVVRLRDHVVRRGWSYRHRASRVCLVFSGLFRDLLVFGERFYNALDSFGKCVSGFPETLQLAI